MLSPILGNVPVHMHVHQQVGMHRHKQALLYVIDTHAGAAALALGRWCACVGGSSCFQITDNGILGFGVYEVQSDSAWAAACRASCPTW